MEDAVSRGQWQNGRTCSFSLEWPHSARAVMVAMGNLALGIGNPDSDANTAGGRALLNLGRGEGESCNRKGRVYYNQGPNSLQLFIPKLIFLPARCI